MSQDDELLEDYLLRQFNELDKLPIKDRRRIILFALIATDAATLINVAVSAAFSKIERLRLDENLARPEDDQVGRELLKRVLALSEKRAEPSLRELRNIYQYQQLYLLFEKMPDELPDHLFE